MKKNKKYLGFIPLGVFAVLLGLGAFLGAKSQVPADTSVISDVTTAVAAPEAVPLAAASTRESTVTDQEINDYIASHDESVLDFYRRFMDTYDWKYYIEDTMFRPFIDIYEADEEGFVDFSVFDKLEFKKGNMYLYNAFTNGIVKSYDYAYSLIELYGLNNYRDKFSMYYSSCEPLSDELSNDVSYSWDDQRICSEIHARFQKKVTQVYGAYSSNGLDGEYRKSSALILVPNTDFTLDSMTRDQAIISRYQGLKGEILVGKTLDKDYEAPSINGTIHLSVNVSNQPSIDTILSYVQAIDETDGVVPIKVEEEGTTYIPGEMAIGDYVLNISATDSSSNIAKQTIYIHRFDSDKPIITGQSSYTVNYTNELTIDKIKESLSITDNIDKDLTLNLVSDNFTANYNRLGTYQVVFNTKDNSNNTSDNFTVVIVVRNEGTPVITAPTEITISISKLLTLEEFKTKVRVVDGYDGVADDYLIEGYQDYAATYSKVGTNDITISETNSGNHTATATVRFIKIDDRKPTFYFNNGYFVSLAEGETFPLNMFKEQAAAVLCLDVADIVSVEGTYDTATTGSYDLMVCLASGEEENFRVFVGSEVKPDETNELQEPEKSFMDQVKDFYKNNSTAAWSITGVSIVAIILLGALIVVIIKKHK